MTRHHLCYYVSTFIFTLQQPHISVPSFLSLLLRSLRSLCPWSSTIPSGTFWVSTREEEWKFLSSSLTITPSLTVVVALSPSSPSHLTFSLPLTITEDKWEIEKLRNWLQVLCFLFTVALTLVVAHSLFQLVCFLLSVVSHFLLVSYVMDENWTKGNRVNIFFSIAKLKGKVVQLMKENGISIFHQWNFITELCWLPNAGSTVNRWKSFFHWWKAMHTKCNLCNFDIYNC